MRLRVSVMLALLTALVACGEDRDGGQAGVEAARGGPFRSAPTLRPDVVRTTQLRPGRARGLLFLAVKRGPGDDGPMIVDDRGRLVWFRPAPPGMAATLFQAQRYRGRLVLTWWEGYTHLGHGHGDYVIADRSYREIARVRASRRWGGDHHEFQLTSRGTALLIVYTPRRMDLRAVGGRREGTIVDSVIQEIDLATGRRVFEWRASEHVPVTEGRTPPKQTKPHDYFHANSIDVDRDGNLLVSARNAHAIYKIDRRSGRVIWRLGGERSDFAMGPGARFAFQHDARRRADGTLSLFDNQATPPTGPESRGLVLALDQRRMRARLVRAYPHPDRLRAGAQGSMQTLPGGNVLTSWGPEERVAEQDRDGRLLLDLRLPAGADTYQAFRFRWRGRPVERPAIAVEGDARGRRVVYASWNGATGVRRWQLLAGEHPHRLAPIASVPRSGFETTLTTTSDAAFLAVQALDADGRILDRSAAIKPRPDGQKETP